MAKIQLKRASTAAQWQASSFVLDAGEPGVALDTGEIRVGNGTDIWANLPVRAGGGTSDWNGILNKPSTFPPTIGSTATTAVAGNDSRLTDARTPKDNSVLNVHVSSAAAINADKLTDGNNNKILTATERTKLAGVATGATANSTDSALRDRTTHTGVTPVAGLGSGTPAAGRYVDGGTGAWTVLPTGGGTGSSAANVMWVANTASARPTVPAGYQLLIIGGTTPPNWMQASDIQLASA